MKQSGYLKRQADVQDRLLQIGTEVGQQQVFDALALALRDPAVMGAFTDKSEWNDYTRAVDQYPNVLWTHQADMLASHVAGV